MPRIKSSPDLISVKHLNYALLVVAALLLMCIVLLITLFQREYRSSPAFALASAVQAAHRGDDKTLERHVDFTALQQIEAYRGTVESEPAIRFTYSDDWMPQGRVELVSSSIRSCLQSPQGLMRFVVFFPYPHELRLSTSLVYRLYNEPADVAGFLDDGLLGIWGVSYHERFMVSRMQLVIRDGESLSRLASHLASACPTIATT